MITIQGWEEFQSEGAFSGQATPVRQEILGSWQRSRTGGVDPSQLNIGHTEIDTDSAFIRAGAPVLCRMADLLVGTSTSLALTDADGVVTWRWESEPSIGRQLDRTEVEVGSLMGEPASGTNGIGLAVAERRPVTVVGAEHFKQPWHRWACSAAPVIHPITRRVCGAVNVACRAEDANHLLQVALRSLTDGVRTALHDAATARERRLVDAFMRFRSSGAAIVVALDRQTMIVNDSAAALGLDRAALWAAVAEAGAFATEIPVTAEFVGLPYQVTPGQPDNGVVLVLCHRSAGSVRPRPTRAGSLQDLGPLENAERQVIVDILAQCNDNKKDAAEKLGISRGTLYQRLRRYQLL